MFQARLLSHLAPEGWEMSHLVMTASPPFFKKHSIYASLALISGQLQNFQSKLFPSHRLNCYKVTSLSPIQRHLTLTWDWVLDYFNQYYFSHPISFTLQTNTKITLDLVTVSTLCLLYLYSYSKAFPWTSTPLLKHFQTLEPGCFPRSCPLSSLTHWDGSDVFLPLKSILPPSQGHSSCEGLGVTFQFPTPPCQSQDLLPDLMFFRIFIREWKNPKSLNLKPTLLTCNQKYFHIPFIHTEFPKNKHSKIWFKGRLCLVLLITYREVFIGWGKVHYLEKQRISNGNAAGF